MRLNTGSPRFVGRPTEYNTLTGNMWGVLHPVFARIQPPGSSSRAQNTGMRHGLGEVAAQRGVRAPLSGRVTPLLAVVVLMMGAAVKAAPRDDHLLGDRMTPQEIEVAIRKAMPLPVNSVVVIDEGHNIGVATNLDTSSVPGAEKPMMYVKCTVEKSAQRQRVHQAIRAAVAHVRTFIVNER